MQTFIKQLKPGTVLTTKTGENYIYLGYYKGIPSSLYNKSTEGFLYIKLDIDLNSEDLIKKLYCYLHWIQQVKFDAYSCYTKQPKNFIELVTQIDLKPVLNSISKIYGLQYVGEVKPRTYRGEVVKHKVNKKDYESMDSGMVILDINTNEYYQGLNTFGKELRKAEICHNVKYIKYIKEEYPDRQLETLKVLIKVIDN